MQGERRGGGEVSGESSLDAQTLTYGNSQPVGTWLYDSGNSGETPVIT